MNDIKILQHSEFVKDHEKNVTIDEELTKWKSQEAPKLHGLVFIDTTGTSTRYLVSLPNNPVFCFKNSDVFKKFITKKSQKSRAKKSSYYGLIKTEEEFLASLQDVHFQLASRLKIAPDLLDYSSESISFLVAGLKELPVGYNLYNGDDSVGFLLIKYIGSTIYKIRGDNWSFRNQAGYDVKIPDTIVAGKNAREYDWFREITSMTVERKFEQYQHVVEAATSL